MAAKSKPIEVKSLGRPRRRCRRGRIGELLDGGRVVRERAAARGRSDRQGRGRRRREDRRLPRLEEADLSASRRRDSTHMAEVLVLVDAVDGKVKKATLELLTAARQLGEPSAVVVGAARLRRPVEGPARRVRREQGLRRRERRHRRLLGGAEGGGAGRGRGAGVAGGGAASPPPRRTRRSPRGSRSSSARACSTTPSASTPSGTRHPADLRRVDHRHREGHQGRAGHHGAAELLRAGTVNRRRRGGAGVGDDLRRRQGRARSSTRVVEEKGSRPQLSDASVVVSGGRGIGKRRQLRDHREARGHPRRGRRAPPARSSTPAGCRTPCRWARPASPSRRSSTSRSASPVPSSTAPACRRPRRSSRSTRTPRRRSSSSPTSASSGDLFKVAPQLAEEITKRKS